MKLLTKGKFWIRVFLFSLLNFFLCFLLGVLFNAKGFTAFFDDLKEKDIWNFVIISIAFAFGFTLWIYNDPQSKHSNSSR
ncbi:MAG: hypothetical protein GC171_14355 [Terrimonas sp.]|nr:hypothetical protein [Terrimonas sp.]